jgi:hypothetical protein
MATLAGNGGGWGKEAIKAVAAPMVTQHGDGDDDGDAEDVAAEIITLARDIFIEKMGRREVASRSVEMAIANECFNSAEVFFEALAKRYEVEEKKS